MALPSGITAQPPAPAKTGRSLVTILSAISLGLVLLSITMPWLVVSVFGQFSFGPLDIIRLMANAQPNPSTPKQSQQNSVLTEISSKYSDSSIALFSSMILYPLSIGLLAAALAIRPHKRSLLGSGAFVAIASCISWIYAIESLKTHIMAASSSSGGFGSLGAGVFNSAVSVGSGTYAAIAGGVIGLVGYYMARSMARPRQPE